MPEPGNPDEVKKPSLHKLRKIFPNNGKIDDGERQSLIGQKIRQFEFFLTLFLTFSNLIFFNFEKNLISQFSPVP